MLLLFLLLLLLCGVVFAVWTFWTRASSRESSFSREEPDVATFESGTNSEHHQGGTSNACGRIRSVNTAMDETPLFVASRKGQVDCVRLLIDDGADVNKARTDNGWTPLYVASQNGNVDCVRLLVENGADVNKATTAKAPPEG